VQLVLVELETALAAVRGRDNGTERILTQGAEQMLKVVLQVARPFVEQQG